MSALCPKYFLPALCVLKERKSKKGEKLEWVELVEGHGADCLAVGRLGRGLGLGPASNVVTVATKEESPE